MSAAFAVAHVTEGFVTAVREYAVQRAGGREQLLQHAEHVRREVGRVVTAAKVLKKSQTRASIRTHAQFSQLPRCYSNRRIHAHAITNTVCNFYKVLFLRYLF